MSTAATTPAPLCNRDACSAVTVGGITLPLCARCLALIAGAVMGFGLSIQLAWPVILVLLLPAVVDGALHHFAAIQSTNARRWLTGIPGGAGIWALAIELLMMTGGF